MYRPLYCKNDIVNRNTTPKVKFFSLICRTQMLKGDAGVNVHCRSVFAAVLNRAVHSRRLQGSLWSWRALIHSQITSNCFEQSIAFLEHFCWQALLHDRRKYQGPPNPPPPKSLKDTHTHRICHFTSLAVVWIALMPARWHLQISVGHKKKGKEKRVSVS